MAKIIYFNSELQNGALEYPETLRAREPLEFRLWLMMIGPWLDVYHEQNTRTQGTAFQGLISRMPEFTLFKPEFLL